MRISDIVIPKYLPIFNNRSIKHIILTSGRAGTKSSYAAIRSDYQLVADANGSVVVLRKHHNKLRKTVYKEMLRGGQPSGDPEEQVPDHEVTDGDHIQEIRDNDVFCRIGRH